MRATISLELAILLSAIGSTHDSAPHPKSAARGEPSSEVLPTVIAVRQNGYPETQVFSETDVNGHQGPAEGWIVNQFGTPKPTFLISTRPAQGLPASGLSTIQSYALLDSGGGDAHPMRQFIAERGRAYTWRVYARATEGNPTVTFGLRNDDSHYDSFASRTLKLDSQWREIVVSGRFPHPEGKASARISAAPGSSIEFASAGVTASAAPAFSGARVQQKVPDEFFGMTVNKLGSHNEWPGYRTQVLRLWDTGTRWMDIEPAKGRWDFRRSDYYVDYAEKHGAQVLFTLGQTPRWASANPKAHCDYASGCSSPMRMDDWREYVRQIATRYGSRVRYWELWNEPDYDGFWTGTPAQLAEMARVASEEIRKVNPHAVLVGPAITQFGMNFLSEFLASPGSQAVDAISFHTYINGSLSDLTQTISNVRSVMKGSGAADTPLWNTEFGVTCDKVIRNCVWPSEKRESIQRVVAALFVMAGEGIDNADFYFWERGLPDAPFGLTQAPGSIRTSDEGRLYDLAVNLLAGSVVEQSFQTKNLITVQFAKSPQKFVALWSEGKAIRMVPPKDWPYDRYEALGGAALVRGADGSVILPASTLVIGSH